METLVRLRGVYRNSSTLRFKEGAKVQDLREEAVSAFGYECLPSQVVLSLSPSLLEGPYNEHADAFDPDASLASCFKGEEGKRRRHDVFVRFPVEQRSAEADAAVERERRTVEGASSSLDGLLEDARRRRVLVLTLQSHSAIRRGTSGISGHGGVIRLELPDLSTVGELRSAVCGALGLENDEDLLLSTVADAATASAAEDRSRAKAIQERIASGVSDASTRPSMDHADLAPQEAALNHPAKRGVPLVADYPGPALERISRLAYRIRKEEEEEKEEGEKGGGEEGKGVFGSWEAFRRWERGAVPMLALNTPPPFLAVRLNFMRLSFFRESVQRHPGLRRMGILFGKVQSDATLEVHWCYHPQQISLPHACIPRLQEEEWERAIAIGDALGTRPVGWIVSECVEEEGGGGEEEGVVRLKRGGVLKPGELIFAAEMQARYGPMFATVIARVSRKKERRVECKLDVFAASAQCVAGVQSKALRLQPDWDDAVESSMPVRLMRTTKAGGASESTTTKIPVEALLSFCDNVYGSLPYDLSTPHGRDAMARLKSETEQSISDPALRDLALASLKPFYPSVLEQAPVENPVSSSGRLLEKDKMVLTGYLRQQERNWPRLLRDPHLLLALTDRDLPPGMAPPGLTSPAGPCLSLPQATEIALHAALAYAEKKLGEGDGVEEREEEEREEEDEGVGRRSSSRAAELADRHSNAFLLHSFRPKIEVWAGIGYRDPVLYAKGLVSKAMTKENLIAAVILEHGDDDDRQTLDPISSASASSPAGRMVLHDAPLRDYYNRLYLSTLPSTLRRRCQRKLAADRAREGPKDARASSLRGISDSGAAAVAAAAAADVPSSSSSALSSHSDDDDDEDDDSDEERGSGVSEPRIRALLRSTEGAFSRQQIVGALRASSGDADQAAFLLVSGAMGDPAGENAGNGEADGEEEFSYSDDDDI